VARETLRAHGSNPAFPPFPHTFSLRPIPRLSASTALTAQRVLGAPRENCYAPDSGVQNFCLTAGKLSPLSVSSVCITMSPAIEPAIEQYRSNDN
jgi:hypothetical protein